MAQRALNIGIVGGLIAGMIELVPILPIQASLGVSPLRVLQSIASGAMGASAYAGGWASAAAGAFFHFLISAVAGIVYAVVAERLAILRRRAVVMGALYGVAVYLVMNYVVVPLSAVAFKPTTQPAMMAISLAVHIVTFAIPIALYVRRRMPA